MHIQKHARDNTHGCPPQHMSTSVFIELRTYIYIYPKRPQIVFELSFRAAGIKISLTFCRRPGN